MLNLKSKILIAILFGGFFIFPAVVLADSLDEQNSFFVDSGYDSQGRTKVSATLRAMGDYIYFYVEDDYYNNLNGTYKNGIRETLEDLADEFDNVIYPKERAVFGSEWSPGIDNDKRITVLVTKLVSNAGGYVNIYDEFPKSKIVTSNEREMIYFNALNVFSSKNTALLAHEFQHLISHYQKTILYGVEEEVWLNEARSEYAPTLCGYNDIYSNSYLSDRVNTFLDSPADPLGEWKNNTSDYGAVNLFLHYLVGQFGEQILTRMILSDKVGIASINYALASLGYTETFSDVFNDWTVANYLNDCQIGSGEKYCYQNANLNKSWLTVEPSASYSGFPNLIVSRSSAVKDWSPRWYRFRQSGTVPTENDTLKLEFSASTPAGNFRVPYIVTDNSQTIVKLISLENQKGVAYIPNFTSLNKVVTIIPFNQSKQSGFSNSDPLASFSFIASSVEYDVSENDLTDSINNPPEPQSNYPEGSLLRAKGGYKVYIIKGNYKRWIQSAEIFNQYAHLRWEDIIEVDQSVVDEYQEAWLIRADNDPRVYELNADGTKHWLNMTAEQFSISGRQWDMVYIINSFERDSYLTGPDVLFQ